MQANMAQPAATHRSSAGTSARPTTDVLGVHVNALDMAAAVATIEGWIDGGDRRYLCACTVHTVMESAKDPAFRRAVNAAGLRTPDGMPLVWLSRWAGHRQTQRVYGPDLLLALCARSAQTGHRHFFYGGQPGVAEALVERLADRFPGLQVAGTLTPPMLPVGAIEGTETLDRLNSSGADVVWVGLGNPKQEWWVANHRPLLDTPVLIAVGAAFDFHSGRVRQAPRWMQRHGLEWIFRLTQDPRRLWKRYLVYNTQFVLAIVGRSIRSRLRSRFAAAKD